MDINVDNNSYIPDSKENMVFNALKNTKVSFVLILLIIIAIYIGIFFLIGSVAQENSNSGVKIFIIILEIILWAMLIGIVYINVQNYNDENYSFKMKMENLFNTELTNLKVNAKTKETKETKDSEGECEKDSDTDKEVFHITNNLYSYQEAKDICEQHNARMATYEEIERAYNKGANWCSYGWSKDQLALFPTQQELYNELKKVPGHEHDCGRPGINGGYIQNKNVRFGVNCYGIKPKPDDKDKAYMESANILPVSENKQEEEKKQIIAGFNKNKWSKYSKQQQEVTD